MKVYKVFFYGFVSMKNSVFKDSNSELFAEVLQQEMQQWEGQLSFTTQLRLNNCRKDAVMFALAKQQETPEKNTSSGIVSTLLNMKSSLAATLASCALLAVLAANPTGLASVSSAWNNSVAMYTQQSPLPSMLSGDNEHCPTCEQLMKNSCLL